MLEKRRIIRWKIGSNTSKRPQRCTVLLDTRTSSRRRLQYQDGKENCANIGRMPIIASVLQCCSKLQDWCSAKTMDPTRHHKMKADEAHDGSGHGAADTNTENSDAESETLAQKTEAEAQKRKQTVVNGDSEHRDEHTN